MQAEPESDVANAKAKLSGRTWADLGHEVLVDKRFWTVLTLCLVGLPALAAVLVYSDLLHVDTTKSHVRIGWDHDRIKEQQEQLRQAAAEERRHASSLRWREWWGHHLRQAWHGTWVEPSKSYSVEGEAVGRCEAHWAHSLSMRVGMFDPGANYGTGEAVLMSKLVVAPTTAAFIRSTSAFRDKCFRAAGAGEDGSSQKQQKFFTQLRLDQQQDLVVVRFIQTDCAANYIRRTVQLAMHPNGEMDYPVKDDYYDRTLQGVRMVPERPAR